MYGERKFLRSFSPFVSCCVVDCNVGDNNGKSANAKLHSFSALLFSNYCEACSKRIEQQGLEISSEKDIGTVSYEQMESFCYFFEELVFQKRALRENWAEVAADIHLGGAGGGGTGGGRRSAEPGGRGWGGPEFRYLPLREIGVGQNFSSKFGLCWPRLT